MNDVRDPRASSNAVAIVGMAFRFPGASDTDTFWRNLADGVESIRRFSREELLAAGVSPLLADDSRFVTAHGAVEDIEGFDAEFFGYSPADAALIDPQQRMFLECAYEALEHAGVVPGEAGPVTGVFGGAGVNFYLIQNVVSSVSLDDVAAVYQGILGGEKDFLTARVAYKLGLRGPSITIQAACATSLVAVHVACQSLLGGECDLALAGGVSLRIPQASGFLFNEGGIYSADGVCRAFDAKASGTVGGSGGGVVVLKRLDDALRDGDRIDGVILGSAVTNDGARKLSFTAPAVGGQTSAISEARAVAGVDSTSIGYAEMHGTGTVLGDPIEIAAMKAALGEAWNPNWRCYIGSLKTNVGHLDTAAGVAGLIKTVLALQHGAIPPTLHFERPNPKIDFESGPLRVCTSLTPWPPHDGPRRASVSAFGLGGNNCHTVLEEAPAAPARVSRDAWRLFPLSARTPGALDRMRSRLADSLTSRPDAHAADVAWTLARGRQHFVHCGVAVAPSSTALVETLRRSDWQTGPRPGVAPRVAFLFPGQGAQRAGVGQELYETEPAFRDAMDACADALIRAGAPDVRTLLFRESTPAVEADLRRTVHAQVVLFALGYALAALWTGRGIVPYGVLGHSSGEYAAAVCAGVMSLEDAARALMARARLMDQLPAGVMAAVGLGEADLRRLLPPGLHIAAVNAAALCTVAGSEPALRQLETRLGDGVLLARLHTAHAFHSPAVDPVLPDFRAAMASVPLAPPRLAFYSAVTGARADDRTVTDASLWVRQIREAVRFGPAVEAMVADGVTAFIELGPGTTLTGLARRSAATGAVIIPGLPATEESKAMLTGLGRLWLAGCEINWDALFVGDQPQCIPLPTYPFEHTRHWIGTVDRATPAPAPSPAAELRADETPGLFVPAWTRAPQFASPTDAGLAGRWLVIGGDDELTMGVVERLRQSGAEVRQRRDVDAGETYAATDRILVTATLAARGSRGFELLIHLARAVAREGAGVSEISALTSGAIDVTGGEPLDPWQAAALSPLLVIQEEFPGVTCRGIDLDLTEIRDHAQAVLAELSRPPVDRVVALRHAHRWTCQIVPAPLPEWVETEGVIRPGGVYMITGGVGALGMTIAQQIAAAAPVRLALVGRHPVDPQSPRGLALAGIEAAGSNVHVYQADCADPAAMRQVFTDLTSRYGRVDGVIHAAGVAGGGSIARRTDQDMAAVLRPKTSGTEVLVSLLAGAPPDFLVLFSSLAAYLPVPGQADYAAANAFLDASAASLRRQGIRATSINWDAWRGVGMAVAADMPEALRIQRDAELAAIGLDPDRACETLWRVIGGGIGQVIVSRRRSFTDAAVPAATPLAPATDVVPASVHDGLAQLWSSLLGVAAIGPADDFFQLGGHSLLATSVTFQIRQRWGCAISVDEVFVHSTFEAMTHLIEGRVAASGDREALLL